MLLDAREARKLGRTRTALNIPLMPQRAWCSQSLNSALTALTASSTRYETPQVPEENTLWILEESGTSSLSNVMACHVFPVFPVCFPVFLVLPCLALPCLAGLATGGSPPFPPCCSSPPRSSRPLDTRFLEPWHTRMCQSNSSTAASVPQILAKSNVWRSECQCVNLQWSLRFIPWASWFSADPISAFLRGSCSMATIPR